MRNCVNDITNWKCACGNLFLVSKKQSFLTRNFTLLYFYLLICRDKFKRILKTLHLPAKTQVAANLGRDFIRTKDFQYNRLVWTACHVIRCRLHIDNHKSVRSRKWQKLRKNNKQYLFWSLKTFRKLEQNWCTWVSVQDVVSCSYEFKLLIWGVWF
jgi:hypothetical protein